MSCFLLIFQILCCFLLIFLVCFLRRICLRQAKDFQVLLYDGDLWDADLGSGRDKIHIEVGVPLQLTFGCVFCARLEEITLRFEVTFLASVEASASWKCLACLLAIHDFWLSFDNGLANSAAIALEVHSSPGPCILQGAPGDTDTCNTILAFPFTVFFGCALGNIVISYLVILLFFLIHGILFVLNL